MSYMEDSLGRKRNIIYGKLLGTVVKVNTVSDIKGI